VRAEIAIRGAGPVGCALALLLQAGGRSVALAERRQRDDAAPAARPIALSQASRIILERAGAWSALAVTPIETVHVSQAGGFGQTRMTAADAGVPALGYVIDYGALAASLRAQVATAGIAIEDAGTDTENREARLLVHAEGTVAGTDEEPYHQTAVAALVGTDPRSGSTAYERFTPDGPLALLPLAGGYGVVWATRAERASALVAMPQQEFLDSLGSAFGARAGRFMSVEGRASVPLALRVRAARVEERQAYVGNSAQTLHPVAGQGLNLGLRDAWELSRAIGEAADPGDSMVLRQYAARRRLDAYATVRVTDLLAGLFTGTNPLARAARGAAMCAIDVCAPARRFFARRMIFGPSAIP
jgi:2-octaprenyl-6-methoxyphenol hydroxylase